jgi:hypothetical protein
MKPHKHFDPDAQVLADLVRCTPHNPALVQLGRETRVLFGRATWFDGDTRWVQLLAVPVERAAENLIEWMRGAEEDDDHAHAPRLLIVCTPPTGRPVVMTAAAIGGGDVDAARDGAEALMLACLPTLLPVLRVVR